jgi:hypothetical protein
MVISSGSGGTTTQGAKTVLIWSMEERISTLPMNLKPNQLSPGSGIFMATSMIRASW